MGAQASKAKQPGTAGAGATASGAAPEEAAALTPEQLAALHGKADALANEIGAALAKFDSKLLQEDDLDGIDVPAAAAAAATGAGAGAGARVDNTLLEDDGAEVAIDADELEELEAELAALEQEGDKPAAITAPSAAVSQADAAAAAAQASAPSAEAAAEEEAPQAGSTAAPGEDGEEDDDSGNKPLAG